MTAKETFLFYYDAFLCRDPARRYDTEELPSPRAEEESNRYLRLVEPTQDENTKLRKIIQLAAYDLNLYGRRDEANQLMEIIGLPPIRRHSSP